MTPSSSPASNRPLALELYFLLLIFLVFPLDELVASYLFGRYDASGSEGFTLAQFLTTALFALAMWKALWRKDSEPLLLPFSDPVPILMLVYIGASLLSVLTSATPENAAGPIMQRIALFAFYILVIYVVRDRRALQLAILFFVASAVLSCAAGLYEIVSGNSVLPEYRLGSMVREGLAMEVTGAYRVQGLGREAGRQASQLLVLFGLLLALFFQASRKARILFGCLTALVIMNIIASSSRSLWLGLVIVPIVVVVTAPLARKRLLLVSSGAVLFIAFLFFILLVPEIAVKDRIFANKGAGRFSFEHRLEVAKISYEMGRRKPLLGVGVGNFLDEYPRHLRNHLQLPPKLVSYPHNAYLVTFAETGLVGLIVYVLMQAAILIQIILLIRYSPGRDMKMIAAGLLGSYVGFLYTLNWQVMLGNKYGWTVMALAMAMTRILEAETHSNLAASLDGNR